MLGAPQALAAGAGLGAVASAAPLAARGRCHHRRRGRRRHRRRAPARPPPAAGSSLVEATDRIGGRCVTDTADLRRAVRSRRALDPHARHQSADQARVAHRARHLSGAVGPARAHRPPQRARGRARGFSRRPGARQPRHRTRPRAARPTSTAPRALPKDLGDWRPTDRIRARPLRHRQGSQRDFGAGFRKSVERDIGAFCRQGYGALLAKLAEGIPVELATPVTQIDTLSRDGRGRGDDAAAARSPAAT